MFNIKVSHENRARALDLPEALFLRQIFRAFSFHVYYALPALHKKLRIAEEEPHIRCLLLHTNSGTTLESIHVRRSIREFLREFYPELANVTAMTLRASFATAMFEKQCRKESIAHLSEEELNNYLAKIMNNSLEQLNETYIATSGNSHQIRAEMIFNLLDTANKGDAEDHSDLYIF